MAAAGGGFPRDLWLVALEQDKQATPGTGMFDCDPHQRLDELTQEDLAGYRLCGLEHRSDIQPLDGRANGSTGRCRHRCVAKMRMKLFELPHLAERSPVKIAAPRLPQIRAGERIEAARRVEPRGYLMGQALVLDEALLAGRADGLFVEALGVQFPRFQTREFGANQCRPVCERCRTIVCPDRYLLKMRYQRFQMPWPLPGVGRIATRRPA